MSPSNDKFLAQLAMTSPAGYATYVSEGLWKRAKHLDLLNRHIVEVAFGRLGILVVCMPPRHGKSELISAHTPPWFLTVFPSKRVILTSYEADFAGEFGHRGRLLYDQYSPGLIGHKLDPDSSAKHRWDIMDTAGKLTGGGMRAVGSLGAITGKGADLFIVDDPIKNSEEADSPGHRDKMWDWFQSTVLSRFEPGAGLILVQTRWHQDDLAGRLIQKLQRNQFGKVTHKILTLPALAEHGQVDPLGRKPGEALWPWRYSKADMEQKKASVSPYWWSCMYQGKPRSRSGRTFDRKWFRIIQAKPKNIIARVRFWDMAATRGAGDYTVGVKMSKTSHGVYYIEHIVRGQWGIKEAKQYIKQTATLDGPEVVQRMEQEPASGGKVQIDVYRTLLRDYDFDGIPTRVKKELTWGPLADEAEAGNVILTKGGWTEEFLDEIEKVPNPRGYDDQVDAASGAFKYLAEIQEDYDIFFI